MRRFLALIALLVVSIPAGLSITGCLTPVGDYCNGLGYGPKTSDVAAIDLEPKTTGISLAWGQTGTLGSKTATTCKGASASISHYNYGSSNLFLADISPSGEICAGTWNRNSPGGIADYTICTPPAGSSGGTCTATSCGIVQMTVSAAGVTSNPVPVYIHPPITSISFSPAGTPNSPENGCVSQNHAGPVLNPNSGNVTVLGPDGQPIPAEDVGTIQYSAVDHSIVSINNTSTSGTGVNGATTANMPGSTVINATVSQASSGSAAGYFYTCPPKSITLSVVAGQPGSVPGSTKVTVGTPVIMNAAITDTQGNPITGVQLDYTSTEPQNIAASSLGQVTATWPGQASISAICQPTSCNPAPIGQIGVFGTGTPVVSNTLTFTSPGRNSNYLWMASTQSQFFSSIDLTTGKPGSPIRLPYVPNSMVMDQAGTNLYFGSYRELMIFSATTNSLSKEDTSVPGVVLAVAPDDAQVIINDQLRHVIYLYSTNSGIVSSIAGVATRAKFSPDGKNVYIVGPNTLYVYNAATGWSSYTLNTTPAGPTTTACNLDNNTPGSGTFDPFCGSDVALTVPGVAAFVSGSPTTAYGFCPNVSNANAPIYYPQATSLAGIRTDALAATPDGAHIIGADIGDNDLTDISNLNIPTGMCPSTTTDASGNTAQKGLTLTPSHTQVSLGITASEIDQVVASPTSSVAFVMYNNNNPSAGTGILPAYSPATGTITPVQLSGGAKAPIAGIFSPNDTLFFVSTSGDNLVHFIDPATLTDTQTINPGLVDANGNPVPVQMMAVKPRSTT